jgi:hypothetical protein
MCFARHLESNVQSSQPGEKYLEQNFNRKWKKKKFMADTFSYVSVFSKSVTKLKNKPIPKRYVYP